MHSINRSGAAARALFSSRRWGCSLERVEDSPEVVMTSSLKLQVVAAIVPITLIMQ